MLGRGRLLRGRGARALCTLAFAPPPRAAELRAWPSLAGAVARALAQQAVGGVRPGHAVPVVLAELCRTAHARSSAAGAGGGAAAAPRRAAAAAAALARPRSPLSSALASSAEAALTVARAAKLCCLFAPLVLLAPVAFYASRSLCPALRRHWFALLVSTLRRGGACWIKWGQARRRCERLALAVAAAATPPPRKGPPARCSRPLLRLTSARPQWAATRADLFPADMCAALGSLQSDAPSHSFAQTRRTVEAAFGQPLEARSPPAPPPCGAPHTPTHTPSLPQVFFSSFEETPVASGRRAPPDRGQHCRTPA